MRVCVCVCCFFQKPMSVSWSFTPIGSGTFDGLESHGDAFQFIFSLDTVYHLPMKSTTYDL